MTMYEQPIDLDAETLACLQSQLDDGACTCEYAKVTELIQWEQIETIGDLEKYGFDLDLCDLDDDGIYAPYPADEGLAIAAQFIADYLTHTPSVDGEGVGFASIPPGTGPRAMWKPCADVAELIGHAKTQYGDSYYWTTHLHTSHVNTEHGRASKEIATRCIALVADIDAYGCGHKVEGKMLAKDIGHALEICKDITTLPPSAVINSGGGVQGFWFFDEPVALGGDLDAIKARWNQATKASGVRHGAPDAPDTVTDEARLMRIPGTVRNKSDQGCEPNAVVIIESDPGVRYTLQDFDQALPELAPEPRIISTPADNTPRPSNWETRPGDDFNTVENIRKQLEANDWKAARSSTKGEEHYTRPGKNKGVSGTIYTDKADPFFMCWTSGDSDLEERSGYSAFRLFTVFKHNGDYKAAAKALAEVGYGEPSRKTIDTDGITPPAGIDPDTGEVLSTSTDLVPVLKDPVTNAPLREGLTLMTHPDGGEQFTEDDWIDLEFWHSRAYLEDIYNTALLRHISPDALYGVIKARVGCTIHNRWQLPAIVASVGAINPFTIIRCVPGDGKTGAVGAGSEMFPFDGKSNGGIGYDVLRMPKFTGAGLAEAYMSEVEVVDPNDPKKTIKKKEFNGRAVYSVIDEGRSLIDSSSNSKTDMISPLLSARMGADIGSQGASVETTRLLPEKLYRFCPVILAQPDIMCDLLQWRELGLPQRFTAYNGSTLRFSGMTGSGDRNNLPTGRRAESPAPPAGDYGVPIHVAQPVEDEIVRLRILRSTPLEKWTDDDRALLAEGDIDMAAHTNFNRLTEAAVLAFMDGRSDVNVEDWELAGYPIDTSSRLWERADVQRDERTPARKSDTQRDAEQVEGKVERLEKLQLQAFTRFATVLLKDNPGNAPVEITQSALGREVAGRVRKSLGFELDEPAFAPKRMVGYGIDECAIEKVDGGYIVAQAWLPS